MENFIVQSHGHLENNGESAVDVNNTLCVTFIITFYRVAILKEIHEMHETQ